MNRTNEDLHRSAFGPSRRQCPGCTSLDVRERLVALAERPQLPAWHAGAGESAWLFVDEIVVQ